MCSFTKRCIKIGLKQEKWQPKSTGQLEMYHPLFSYDNFFVVRNFLFFPLTSLPEENICSWQFFCMKIMLFFPKERFSFDTKNLFLLQKSIGSTEPFLFYLAGNTILSNLQEKHVNFCWHFIWAWRFHGSLAPWLPQNIPPCSLVTFFLWLWGRKSLYDLARLIIMGLWENFMFEALCMHMCAGKNDFLGWNE